MSPNATLPATYEPHSLHRGERDWIETNCYVDVWIEILHGLGHEPLAGLGFTLRTDLEADQWTFFKFSHDELYVLYGIDVIELNPWQSVIVQTVNEVRAGRIPLVEVDAFFLPDTAGTTYRSVHSKTSIGITAIDVDARSVSYFHNAGFYVATGDDFTGLFPSPEASGNILPPYIEVVKPQAGNALVGEALVGEAVVLLRRNLRRIPAENPFIRFAKTLSTDLDRIRHNGGSDYHDFAFANFRQFGAAFSLAAAHLSWLRESGFVANDAQSFEDAIEAFNGISSTAKSLQFQSARAAIAGKVIDVSGKLQQLIVSWDSGMSALRSVFG